jgi:hypothetical protein
MARVGRKGGIVGEDIDNCGNVRTFRFFVNAGLVEHFRTRLLRLKIGVDVRDTGLLSARSEELRCLVQELLYLTPHSLLILQASLFEHL